MVIEDEISGVCTRLPYEHRPLPSNCGYARYKNIYCASPALFADRSNEMPTINGTRQSDNDTAALLHSSSPSLSPPPPPLVFTISYTSVSTCQSSLTKSVIHLSDFALYSTPPLTKDLIRKIPSVIERSSYFSLTESLISIL